MSIKGIALKIYFIIRLPWIMIAALLFNARAVPGITKPKRILIVRLDRLGDLVLTVPVIDNLKLYYPEAEMTILVRPYLKDLAGLIGSIDKVMVYEGLFASVKLLREKKFDMVVDMLLDYTLKPALLASLSGAPKRIGFPGGYRERLFTDVAVPGRLDRSMADINLEIVRSLGVPVKIREPRITLEGAKKGERHIVAIHPGGYYPSQRWSPERFADLIDRITGCYDVDVVIIGGPGEEEIVGEIMPRLKGKKSKSIFPGIEEMALLFARSDLLVCNNSGPLHLAAALGVPTVSVMGPTDPDLWYPIGAGNVVIRKDIPCSPCSRGRCRGHECLEAITALEVFDKVKVILDGTAGIKKH